MQAMYFSIAHNNHPANFSLLKLQLSSLFKKKKAIMIVWASQLVYIINAK